jgi:hypothetical protein
MNVSIIFMDNCCIFNLTYIHDKSTFHRSLGPVGFGTRQGNEG